MAYTVTDLMVQQAPQIGPMINQKMMARPTPWITLGRKETWSDEMSSKQKTMQFDRAMLSESGMAADLVEEVDWADVATDVTLNDSEANHLSGTGDGLPPSDTVTFTETLRDYRLQHKAVWGPPMNTNNLRDKFMRVKQMGACVDALADQGRELQINRGKNEYTRVADKLLVLDSGFNLTTSLYGSVAFPAPTGTDSSILTNEFTDIIYEYLNHQGGGAGSLGEAGGSSSYSLITSPRSSRRLIMADPERREDFRYSSQNEYLLKSMGQKVSYNGFAHTCDEKTNRWEQSSTGIFGIATTVAGAASVVTYSAAPYIPYKGTTVRINAIDYVVSKRLTQVPGSGVYSGTLSVKRADGTAPAITSAVAGVACAAWYAVPQFHVATTGYTGDGNTKLKRVPNPNWLTATWEDTYIYHQGVCTTFVPKAITSVGQATFDPVNYAGTYRWTNYEDRDNNPDGSIGQFRGVWSNGTRPDSPEFGVVIRHLAVAFPDGRIIDGSSLG
jgi:hypothetical protein